MASHAIIVHVVVACLRVKPQLIGAVTGSVGILVTAILRDTALVAQMSTGVSTQSCYTLIIWSDLDSHWDSDADVGYKLANK